MLRKHRRAGAASGAVLALLMSTYALSPASGAVDSKSSKDNTTITRTTSAQAASTAHPKRKHGPPGHMAKAHGKKHPKGKHGPPGHMQKAHGWGKKNNGGGGAGGGLTGGSPNGLPAVGTQFHGTWGNYNDAQRAEVLDKLKAMGATWVRIDIGWPQLQPNRGAIDANSWGVQNIDKSISMAHARGLKVLGTFWLTPGWANGNRNERVGPNDPSDYANALGWSAKHWEGKVQAWEVWNEPNSNDFLVGANVNEYTKLLCAGYRGVQRTAPAVPVVFGGPIYNDTDWISRSYQAGAKGCFDIMATHPYVAPADKGPGYTTGRSNLWEFNHLSAVRQLMVSKGDAKPIWATEMGWSSHANRANQPNWSKGVTEAEQARFSVEAIKMLRDRHPYVTNAFFYNERAKPGEDVHQRGYGIMTENFQPKPVYWALKNLLR